MTIAKDDILQLIKNAGVSTDIDNIKYETSLQEAGFDSLDKVNLLFEVEEKYDVKISDDEVTELDSIDSIVELVEKKIREKQ